MKKLIFYKYILMLFICSLSLSAQTTTLASQFKWPGELQYGGSCHVSTAINLYEAPALEKRVKP